MNTHGTKRKHPERISGRTNNPPGHAGSPVGQSDCQASPLLHRVRPPLVSPLGASSPPLGCFRGRCLGRVVDVWRVRPAAAVIADRGGAVLTSGGGGWRGGGGSDRCPLRAGRGPSARRPSSPPLKSPWLDVLLAGMYVPPGHRSQVSGSMGDGAVVLDRITARGGPVRPVRGCAAGAVCVVGHPGTVAGSRGATRCPNILQGPWVVRCDCFG